MTLIEFAETFVDIFIYMELPFECQGMVMRIISTETVFIHHGSPGIFTCIIKQIRIDFRYQL